MDNSRRNKEVTTRWPVLQETGFDVLDNGAFSPAVYVL